MVTQRLGALDLVDSFMNANDYLRTHDIDELLADTAREPAQPVDLHVVDAMRTTPGFNLPRLNVERARERCLPSYGEMLAAFDVPAPTTWLHVTGPDDAQLAELLADVYGDDPMSLTVDPLVAGFAEQRTRGETGQLLKRCILDQLLRSVEGDAYYYQWGPTPSWDSAEAITAGLVPLGKIIARNTYGNAHLASPERGSVFFTQP
jgi:hypothetical protein